MKQKWKSSIFVKTQVYLVVFCVVLLLLVWLFEIIFFSHTYSKYQISTVTSIANIIAKSKDLTAEEVESIAYENNVCISLFDSYGDIREYNQKMNGCNLNSESVTKTIYSFLNSNKESVVKTINFNDQKGFLYGVKNGNMDIFIYSPLEDHNIASTIVRGQLIYIIIAAIIISSAVAIYLSSLITRPIREITKNAVNIGKENYENIFEETGIKEIDDLQESLNTAQKELAKVQTYQKDLLANVSHDLKTPLTMIKAYAEKIKDISYKDKAKLDSDTEIIIDEVDRLTLLVNDILTLSKMQNSSEKLDIKEYNISNQIKNTVKKYDIIKDAEAYTFIVDVKDDVYIKADESKINQVIYNLINNAINYTGDDKKVYINLRKEGKDYIFSVKDTGKGIKKSELKNIWTKYYKNDKNHKRNVISTGIGLSIVKEILEKHHFEYGVNTKEKQGSEFYFKFKEVKQSKNRK